MWPLSCVMKCITSYLRRKPCQAWVDDHLHIGRSSTCKIDEFLQTTELVHWHASNRTYAYIIFQHKSIDCYQKLFLKCWTTENRVKLLSSQQYIYHRFTFLHDNARLNNQQTCLSERLFPIDNNNPQHTGPTWRCNHAHSLLYTSTLRFWILCSYEWMKFNNFPRKWKKKDLGEKEFYKFSVYVFKVSDLKQVFRLLNIYRNDFSFVCIHMDYGIV